MATSNAATTYLENKILSFIFKNNAGSFATPGTVYMLAWQRQFLTQRLVH